MADLAHTIVAEVRSALDGVRAAVAEGEAIVSGAREHFFARRKLPLRAPMLEPPPQQQCYQTADPHQYLNECDRSNVQAARTMLALARLTKKPGLQQASYRDADIYMARLRAEDRERVLREPEKEPTVEDLRPDEAELPEHGSRKKPRKQWQVLPPDGTSDCDIDWESGGDAITARELRRNAATHQAAEARRLARDYALLRPATQRSEVSAARIAEVSLVIKEWEKTLEQLRGIKKGV